MSDETILDTLRKAASAVYIAVDESVAEQISKTFLRAADRILTMQQELARRDAETVVLKNYANGLEESNRKWNELYAELEADRAEVLRGCGVLQTKLYEAKQAIEELEAAQAWVPVSERLPDVLEIRVKLKDGSEINGWAQSDGDVYWKGCGQEIFITPDYITHWMPLPTPPQEPQ